MNRLISFLIKLERRLRSPRVLSQLRYLGWQWLQVRRMVALTLILITALSLSLFWGWRSMTDRFAQSQPRYGGTYTEALAGRSEIINPLFSPSNPVDADIVRLVYSGLLRRDVDGTLKPDLAASFTASPDQSTYNVKLRRELRWQDDVVITARDVLYTIEVIQHKDYEGPLKTEWAGVAVSASGDYDLTFKLQTPYAFFPVDLTLPILPWHLLKDVPAKNVAFAAFNDRPVGSGPYSFVSRRTVDNSSAAGGQVQEVLLRRNKLYHGTRAYIDEVVFKVFDSPKNAYRAYERRAVMAVGGIGPEDSKAAARWKDLNRFERTLPQYSAVFFNTDSKGAPVSDRKVRLALSQLIDRGKLIASAVDGRAFPAYYPLIAGEVGYDPSLPRVLFNPTEAARLLDEAGWAKGRDGKRAKAGQPLKIALVTGDTPTYHRASDFIERAWEEAGATVDVTRAGADLQDRYIRGRNYQALLFGINMGATGDLYPFWHSSGIGSKGLNLSNYSNPVVDRSLEQARVTSAPGEIKQKYDRAQRAWLQDVPAQVLYTPIYEIGVDTKVDGVKVGELSVPADRFNGFRGWYIKSIKKL